MPEFDYTAAALKSRPRGLSTLMSSASDRGRLWRPEELAAIFRHQLSAPVLLDLGGFDPGTARTLKRLGEAEDLLLKSFSTLFQHPTPPRELLELAKDFAKANSNHPDSCLPAEIATALYFTSIAVAIVRLRCRISHLPDTELRRGLEWVRTQPWVDVETKQLVSAALDMLPQLEPSIPERQ